MKKTIFSVIASNFLSSGLGFLINVFLARYLTVTGYGRINLIFSFIIILFSLFEFNFGNSLIVFYKRTLKTYNENPNDLLFFINKLFLKYLPYSIPFIIISLFILKKVYSLSTLELVIISGNFYLFLIYRYIATLHQAIGDWRIFNFLNVMNNVIKFIAMALAVLLISNFVTAYESILIGNGIFPIVVLIIAIVYSKDLIKVKSISNDKRYKKIFYRIILPLGISNIFVIVSMRADNLIIEKVLGSEAVGIYAAANVIALMFPLITSALRNVFLQEGAGKGKFFLIQILNRQKKYGVYVLGILLFAFLISKPMFSVFYGVRYNESIILFRILLIPYVGGIFFTPLESFFYSYSPNKIRNLKLIQMVVVVLMAIILIQYFQLIGVALAVALSRIYGWVYLMWNSHKVLKQ